jgi:hypothetical protein
MNSTGVDNGANSTWCLVDQQRTVNSWRIVDYNQTYKYSETFLSGTDTVEWQNTTYTAICNIEVGDLEIYNGEDCYLERKPGREPYKYGRLVIHGGGTLNTCHDKKCSQIVAGELTIEEGGKISADGEGRAGTPGRGRTDLYGGSYGGVGGLAGVDTVLSGSLFNPDTPGVGGFGAGDVAGSCGGDGGGVVDIVANVTFHLFGTVTASGSQSCSKFPNSKSGGGGSGGSIKIRAERMIGGGLIKADGGIGSNGGGGSGGRVGLHLVRNDFDGLARAWGGDGGKGDGQTTPAFRTVALALRTSSTPNLSGMHLGRSSSGARAS